MKKRFSAVFLMFLVLFFSIIGLTGCGNTGREQSSDVTAETFEAAIGTYEAAAEISEAAAEISEAVAEISDVAAETSESAVEISGVAFDTSDAAVEISADSEYEALPEEDGSYTSKDDVALYLHVYGKLPGNFITKKEARELGWEGGELESYAPGKSIGGDRFGNYEGLLPEADGRTYYECDIDTLGKKRGAKRIVYSNDGLIYYTEDHYETFTLLYGAEE